MTDKRRSLEVPSWSEAIDALRDPSSWIRDRLGTAIAQQPFTVCYVYDRFSDFSPLRDITVGGFCDYFLSEHCEQLRKDRHGTVYADLLGQRTNTCARSVSALVYDIDGQRSYASIRDQRERNGHVGASWTTFSHANTISTVNADALLKKFDYWPVYATDELVQQFLREDSGGRLAYLKNPRVLDDGQWRTVKGEKIYRVEHDPVDRVRDLYFLDEPIELAEVGIDGFKAIYRAVGDAEYGEGIYDASCCNPSRIHWNPAHAAGAPWELDIFPGTFYRWREVWDRLRPAVEAGRVAKEGRAKAHLDAPPASLAEIAHALKSISPSIGRKDWFACIGAIHHETEGSEEGRQLAHDWSAGDQRQYDPDDLDGNVWSWFSGNRDGYTIGTLHWLAKKSDPDYAPLGVKIVRPKISIHF